MKKARLLTPFMILPLAFSCAKKEDSDASNQEGAGALITAQFIDAPVKGLGLKRATAATETKTGRWREVLL